MAAKTIIAAIPTEGKHIRFDRETKDYACYLDGQLIGYEPNYSAAETLIDRTYSEMLERASAPVAEPEPQAEPFTVPIPTVPATTTRGSWNVALDPIDGCEVNARYSGRELMCVEIEWHDLSISVYGDDYLNLEVGEGLGFSGDIYVREWRIIAELARTNIIDRLIAMHRHYATAIGGWACEGCGGTLAPADEDQICQACRTERRLNDDRRCRAIADMAVAAARQQRAA